MLPSDFAPGQLAYYYFSVWKQGEVFEIIHDAWVAKTRVMKGRKKAYNGRRPEIGAGSSHTDCSSSGWGWSS